jgi:hypothetical protein
MTGETASRAVRIRPLRKRTVDERAVELPEGSKFTEFVEVWIVGDLVAVIRPGATPARSEMVWATEFGGQFEKDVIAMTQTAAALAFLWSKR